MDTHDNIYKNSPIFISLSVRKYACNEVSHTAQRNSPETVSIKNNSPETVSIKNHRFQKGEGMGIWTTACSLISPVALFTTQPNKLLIISDPHWHLASTHHRHGQVRPPGEDKIQDATDINTLVQWGAVLTVDIKLPMHYSPSFSHSRGWPRHRRWLARPQTELGNKQCCDNCIHYSWGVYMSSENGRQAISALSVFASANILMNVLELVPFFWGQVPSAGYDRERCTAQNMCTSTHHTHTTNAINNFSLGSLGLPFINKAKWSFVCLIPHCCEQT